MKKLTFILLLVGLSFVGYGQNIRGNSLWSRTTIASDTTYTPTGTEPTGTAYYDKENRTISVALGNGVVMQFNQESMIQVHNGSGATIMNGRVLGAIGGANDRVSVGYADKSKRYDNLIMSTEVIPADSSGLAVEIAGRVNGVNTGGFPVGKIYLDTLGLITAEQGIFPDYNYPIGAIVKTGVTDGIIQFRSDGVNYRNSINDAFDGAVRETFDFRTFSDGTTVYGVLSNPTGADNLTLMFSNGWFDYPVPDTIPLTAGTATNPQSSYVYIDKETRTLQSNTTGFDNTIEHAQIAKIALLDAATTQTYGAIRNQNTNNHLKYDHNNGHIVHLGERMRVLNAQWESGVGLTVSGTPTNLYLATTAGKVWQLHLQSFPAQDMSAGSDIHIVNDFTTPYRTTTNLNTVTTYSDGSTWNNEWQNLVVWGVANKTGEISHIMLNLSSEGYQSEEDAFEDANNYSSYIIPRTFRGVGFLIGRITVRRSPAGYEYNPSTGFLNLLGYYPNNTAGGGTGASGIIDFLQLEDTPSSYLGEAFKFVRVASGETALEFVGGEQILLTDFDTTGFTLEQSQVINLVDTVSALRSGISTNSQAIIDSSASLQGQIDLNTTHRLSDGDLSATNELQTISKVGSTVTLSDGGGSFTDENTQLSQSQVNAYESDPTVSTYTKSLTSASKLLTEIKTVDGSASGLDADLLDGYSSLRYLHKTYYSASSGILVQTDIPYPSATMFTMEVTANGYTGDEKINISTQGYVYSTSGTILAAKGIADNYSETIYYQIRNGYLYIWFPVTASYQTYNVEVFAGNTSESMINRVVNVSNSTKPTDATIEVSFVPKERWHSGNFDPATKQDLLTGNETVFDGWDKNVADDFSGDYNDLINKPDLSNLHPALTKTGAATFAQLDVLNQVLNLDKIDLGNSGHVEGLLPDANVTDTLTISTTKKITTLRGDNDTLLVSRNTAPTTNPVQFYIKHNYGNITIGNPRGVISFASDISSPNLSGTNTGDETLSRLQSLVSNDFHNLGGIDQTLSDSDIASFGYIKDGNTNWDNIYGFTTLALGETSTTAYRGDRGKIAYDYSQIGHVPTSTYTASDVLTKIKTVDGSGSGLDADLLDGVQLSSILNADGNYLVKDTRNVTPVTDIGAQGVRFDFKHNAADGLNDGGTYHSVMTIQDWLDASGGDIHELAFTNNDNIYLRGADIGGTWRDRYKLFHSGNLNLWNGSEDLDVNSVETTLDGNSTQWNDAYSHSQITTGNPHQLGIDELVDGSNVAKLDAASHNFTGTGDHSFAGRVGIGTSAFNSTSKMSIMDGLCSFSFNRGSSNQTPNISVGLSTGKSLALLVGTMGSSFTFDRTGFFAIGGDTKANIDGGSSGGGTTYLMVKNGNTLIGTTIDNGNKLQVNGNLSATAGTFSGTVTALGGNSTQWNDAYNNKITSASVTGTTTKTITLNQQDGGTVTASWTDETVTDGDKGDITVSDSGATWDIDNSGVTAGNYGNASFDVDADGRITYAQSYRGQIGYSGVSVYANNTQSPTSSGTIISWGGEQYDTDTYHDTGTSSRITMPSFYASLSIAKVTISLQLKALSNFTGKVELIKNGTTTIREWDLQDSGLTGQMSVYASDNFTFSSGDYIEIKVTTSINTSSSTALQLRPQLIVELLNIVT